MSTTTNLTPPHIDSLGLSLRSLAAIQDLIHQPYGLMIIAGPAGSGKTTTSYSILQELNHPYKKIFTLERSIEYNLDGIRQIEWPPERPLSSAIVSIVMQDPDVLMVCDIPDMVTADRCAEAAATQHLSFATIESQDALSAIKRLLTLGMNGAMLAYTLTAVIGQKLVRKICQECKLEYTPATDDPMFAALGINDKDAANCSFFRGAGCNSCDGTGYLGYTGMFEVLTMSRLMLTLICRGADLDAIAIASRVAGNRTLRDDGR